VHVALLAPFDGREATLRRERLTPGIFEYKYALLVVWGKSRPVRRQDAPPERRVPYVRAISFDDHPAIRDTHEYPSRLDRIAEQLDA